MVIFSKHCIAAVVVLLLASSSEILRRPRFTAVLLATNAAIAAGLHDDDDNDDDDTEVPATVDVESGRVRGRRYRLPELGLAGGGVAFLGIPFAEPPTGRRRFRRPEAIARRWTDAYNATSLPNSCHQAPDLFFGADFAGSNMWNPNTAVSEDCLYLNVWVPSTTTATTTTTTTTTSGFDGGNRKSKDKARKQLAVMVWIFGGGFYSGTTTLDVYDGRILASANGVVVVSIGYRVGALGFLCLDPSSPTSTCNVGLYDQLLALDWIRRNVAGFGGDPDRVTLFGESAGAASVGLHLVSPLSGDKFQRAVLQSGSSTAPWALTTVAEARRRAVELAVNYLDCPPVAGDDELVDCLRRVDARRLVDAQWVARGILQFPFLPVVDGRFLVETPAASVAGGRFKRCPLVVGSNLNEASWFLVYDLPERLTIQRADRPREAADFSSASVVATAAAAAASDGNGGGSGGDLVGEGYANRAHDGGASGNARMTSSTASGTTATTMSRETFTQCLTALFFYFPQYRDRLNSSVARDAIAFQYTDWTASSPDDGAANARRLDAAVTDYHFVCPLNELAGAYAGAGLPVYKYRFTHRYAANPWPAWMGVLHGDDVLFAFGRVLRPELNFTDDERRLGRRMMKYWTNFAKTG